MLENILNGYTSFGEEPATVHISNHVPQFVRNEDGYLTTTTASNAAFLSSIDENSNPENTQSGSLSSFNTQVTRWTVKEKQIEGAKRKIKARENCGTNGVIIYGHGCNVSYTFSQHCRNPFCPTCARLGSVELARKYEPILKKFSKYTTKFLTLTMKNVELEGLNGAIDSLMKSFTCLKDIRFGPGTFKWYDELFPVLLEYSKLEKIQQERQMYLYDKFKKYMLKIHKGKHKSPKLRNVSKGLARLEIVNKGNGYHVHLHVVIDIAAPIPQELISHLWEQLTSGSMVIDIRRVYGDFTKELLKYQMKYWEFNLTDEEMLVVLAGLHNRRKVWTWGVEVQKVQKTCICGDENCETSYEGSIRYTHQMTKSVIEKIRDNTLDVFGYNSDGEWYQVLWGGKAFIVEKLE